MGCLKLSNFHSAELKIISSKKVLISKKSENYARSGYMFGFNGQMKVNEMAGVGNHNTTLFWEYDTRLGRRWNLDPVDQISVSNYATLGNSPISLNDLLGDEVKPYGAAELTNTTLSDKGGIVDRAGQKTKYKDAVLTPAYSKEGDLVGYNVYDARNTESKLPILQMDKGDVGEFKKNYEAYMYHGNQYAKASEGQQKMITGMGYKGGSKMFLDGLKQENKEKWTDPRFVMQVIVSTMHAGLSKYEPSYNKVNLTSPDYVPVAAKQVPVKIPGLLKTLNRVNKGTWVKVYEASYIRGQKAEVHYFMNKNTGQYFDSKIKRLGWSEQFLKGKNKIIEH